MLVERFLIIQFQQLRFFSEKIGNTVVVLNISQAREINILHNIMWDIVKNSRQFPETGEH